MRGQLIDRCLDCLEPGTIEAVSFALTPLRALLNEVASGTTLVRDVKTLVQVAEFLLSAKKSPQASAVLLHETAACCTEPLLRLGARDDAHAATRALGTKQFQEFLGDAPHFKNARPEGEGEVPAKPLARFTLNSKKT